MEKRELIVAVASVIGLSILTPACTTTGGGSGDAASRRQAINENADAALTNLYQQVNESKELVNKASGVLVFPAVASEGFVVGGEGPLREGGKTSAFYRMTQASAGFLGGGRSQAIFVLFMTPQALAQFKATSGWTVGVDGSIALINVSSSRAIDTQTVQQPIVGFALTNAGGMASLSLNGNRFTRIDM